MEIIIFIPNFGKDANKLVQKKAKKHFPDSIQPSLFQIYYYQALTGQRKRKESEVFKRHRKKKRYLSVFQFT